MSTYTSYRVNVADRKSIQRVTEELKQEKLRRMQIVDKFLQIYGKRGVKVVRDSIAAQHPKYNSQLTASVSYRVTGNRVTIWMDNPKGTGALYFEYGTGPVGAANAHPDPDGWEYRGKPWYTKADGKDMAGMYGWKDHGGGVYLTQGQPSHPFWHNAKQILMSGKFVDECWMEAKKRA